MNRVLASFTKSEKSIIVFVMFLVGTGFGLQQWREARHQPLVFQAADTAPHSSADPKSVITPAGRIDLNTADQQALEVLPDVGPATATAIIKHREANGPFRSLDDLDKVPGIGPVTLSKLSPMVDFKNAPPSQATPPVTVAPAAAPLAPAMNPAPPSRALPFAPAPQVVAGNAMVNINSAGVAELETLSGIGPALAQRIVQDRQTNGRYPNPGSLARVKGIGVKVLEKNRGRITAQ